MLDAMNAIELYMQDAPDRSEFITSGGLYQDAVARNIEIIGEAAGKVSRSLGDKYPNIPWIDISGMRNKIIHEYANVDWELVWEVATKDVKVLRKQMEDILRAEL